MGGVLVTEDVDRPALARAFDDYEDVAAPARTRGTATAEGDHGNRDLTPVHLRLADLPLESVRAHDGEGRIRVPPRVPSRAARECMHFVDYAVLPPGASIGVHTHGRNGELYLVLEGTGTMHLDAPSSASVRAA